jgi:phosphoglycerate kinase
MPELRTLSDITNWYGSKVFLRASLNVPLVEGMVRNRFRLERVAETIRQLQDAGASVVVAGHIGRDPEASLRPVGTALQDLVSIEWGGSVSAPDFVQRVQALKPGSCILVENLRQDERERANDPQFAADLAAPFDLYVNDAFSVMHREHASMVGVPQYLPAYAGNQVVREIGALQEAMQPQSPSLFLLGGAKFDTKLGLVEQYLHVYDEVFLGGALAHDALVARGYEVGQSLLSDLSLDAHEFICSENVLLPTDVVVQRADGSSATVPVENVTPTDTIFDCGPETVSWLSTRIAAAQTVLWNGPFGNYEAGFVSGTEGVARSVADSAAASYVGGGDTVAAIDAIQRNDDFTFISTGGGAMLQYLEHGELPALAALYRATT